MKKQLGMLLGGVALMSGLFACSTEGSGSTDGPVEIEFWYGLGSEAGNKMEELIVEFNESQDEVVLKGVSQADYSETYQNLQAALASNTAPAVALLENSTMVDLAGRDILAPLNEFMDTDESFEEADYLSVFMENVMLDDTYYGLPGYGTTQVMYYRTDLFEEADIDADEAFSSWESLLEAGNKIIEETDASYGWAPMWGESNLIDIAQSNGGLIVNDEGTEVLIDSPEWVEAWEFIRTALHEDDLMKINSGGQGWEYWYRTIDDVINGSVAGYTGSSGDKGNLDFDIIDSAIQPGMNGNPAQPSIDGLVMAIPNDLSDEEKEAGWKWMSYFTSPEVTADWAQTIGYIPVRESAMEVPSYVEFAEENPYLMIPFEQAQIGASAFIDPTGNQIIDALNIAADKVELENIPAEEALAEAKEQAQAALDKVNE
ncbi:ABC transporter substrate-binding protein [Alkalicoccobacillus porphyridii]|uniref:ABC transporter substrate-binding protein n=1 Tax=Alkalicoccobacillus porphyridii TaxID=2597270 RepID=A0A554A162_9BACI|nr:ABC transporter substrate-binding protein [Alkalicoccobacillus porphyridii]TSB47415.1 ABC transporter substrate-binding protein [Alkalicoccobacillus porphyridii]